MAEYFVFRPSEQKIPHWSTVPNDIYSLGVAGFVAAAALAVGASAGYYDFSLGDLPLDQDDGAAPTNHVDVDVF